MALAYKFFYDKASDTIIISQNVCLDQIKDKHPRLSSGPSFHDPIFDKTTELSGVSDIILPLAFSHFQIGSSSGTSITTKPFFEGENAGLDYSQVSYGTSGSMQSTNNHDINLKGIQSVVNLGSFQIVVHQNPPNEGFEHQNSTKIIHKTGATLSLSHEWVGGVVQAVLDESSDTLILIGSFLTETSSISAISTNNGSLEIQELAPLEFQADRAYFDFNTSTLLYWKSGIEPLVGLKHINFRSANSAHSARDLNIVYNAVLSRVHEDSFEIYNFERAELQFRNYFGTKKKETIDSQQCADKDKIDVHHIGNTNILKPSQLYGDHSTLVIMLDGGPAFKQSSLLGEKQQLLASGWSVLASDYPGSWGYGRTYLNQITHKDYNMWAEEVCAIVRQEKENYQSIILRAYSLGALPTGHLINTCGSMIDAYAFVAPALGIKEYFSSIPFQTDPIIYELIDYRLDELEENLIDALSQMDRSKIRIVIGKNDDRISINYLENIATKLNVRFTVLERMTHYIHPNKAYISAVYGAL